MTRSFRGSVAGAAAAVVALVAVCSGPTALHAGEPAPTGARAPASSEEAREVARNVQRRYDATDDLRATFTQELRLAAGGQVIRSKGRMSFAKPGRMRWEYDEPDPQTIVADGTTLWIHQPEDAQVLKAPLEEAFRSDTPVSFLFGVARLERDFTPSLEKGTEDDAIRLRLEPKSKDQALGVLFLDVDPKSWDIRAATIVDALGNRTEVRLSGLERNRGLDRSLFVFERPPGTDVIEAPGA